VVRYDYHGDFALIRDESRGGPHIEAPRAIITGNIGDEIITGEPVAYKISPDCDPFQPIASECQIGVMEPTR
jgi:hypothetical protein